METNSTGKTRELFNEYMMKTYAPAQVFVRGEGAYLFDPEGNRYLDFGTGISVCNLGHCHPAVTAAIVKQAGELVHVSNLYMNQAAPRLAQKLVQSGFDGLVFLSNSGAEANEGLIKFARKWGNANGGRNQIICMNDSFHGRTLATLGATGRSKYRQGFEPDMPGFTHVEFNNLGALKAAITPDVCAILLEPVQGEGGIIPAAPGYLQEVRSLCNEHNILLLFDEIQCGMGRMGTLFAHQSYGVVPDAFSLAKALGNGLPIGAFLVSSKYAGVFTPGTHGSTFGGNAVAAAAALAVLGVMTAPGFLDNVTALGSFITCRLQQLVNKYDFVHEIRGRGMMIGVVLDSPAAPLQEILLKEGLITLTAGENVLRLLPPLTLTEGECAEALLKMEKGCEAFARLRLEGKI